MDYQRKRKKKEEAALENCRKYAARLAEYCSYKNLTFENITPDFLIKFETTLHGEGFAQKYIHMIIRCIRTMFNADLLKKVITYYPFEEYEIPESEKPGKDYLALKEIDKLESLLEKTEDPFMRESLTYFLLGCYTGFRVSDWKAFSLDKNVREGVVMLREKQRMGGTTYHPAVAADPAAG